MIPVAVIALAGLAVLFLVAKPTIALSSEQLSHDDVAWLANDVDRRFHGEELDTRMLMTIAWIESSWRPNVARYEPHIGDWSLGLMQTLIGTASWLHDTQGYGAYEVNVRTLRDPEVSMYFGAAYVRYLQNLEPTEEFVVRAYNTGPGNWQSSAGAAYWHRYLVARREIFGDR